MNKNTKSKVQYKIILYIYIYIYIRAHVRKRAAARAAAVLPVVYAAYTVHFQRSTRLSSRVSHVTFPTVVTVSIVRGSILFVLVNS